MKRKIYQRILISLLSVSALIAIYFFFFKKTKSRVAEINISSSNYTAEDNIWELAAHLAAIDDIDMPRAEFFIDEEIKDLKTADDIIEYVDAAVSINPGAGHLLSPTDMLSSGIGTSLDRALLLKWLFDRKNIESEILYLPVQPGIVYMSYGISTPLLANGIDSAIASSLEDELEQSTDPIYQKIESLNQARWNEYTNNKTESRVYWVRYKESGNWLNFVPGDCFVDSTRLSDAISLSEADLQEQSWTTEIRINNIYSTGSKQNVFAQSFLSSRLHNTPVTLLNKPLDSLTRFNTELRIGEVAAMQGSAFSISDPGLVGQEMELVITGPREKRTFRRKFAELSSLSNSVERALEMGVMVKLTELNGLLSDDQFAHSIITNLQQASDYMFDDSVRLKSLNSVVGLSLLDASQRYAGQIGKYGQSVLTYRGRPAIVLETQSIKVSQEGLKEMHAVDLVDPGHAILSTNTESAIKAAIEQSIIDGNLESLIAYNENAVMSQQEIDKMLAANKNFSIEQSLADTEFDTLPGIFAARYILGGSGVTRSGWRIDPGPQLVPILQNGTGGLFFWTGSFPRFTGDLCNDLTWMTMFIPMRAMPSDVLLNGFIKYQCRLAEAYNRVADVLSGLMDPNTNEDSTAKKLEELEKHIKGMGPEFMKDIVKDLIWSSAMGAAARPVSNVAQQAVNVFGSMGRGMARQAKERFSSFRDRMARNTAESRKATPREIRRTSEELKKRGLTKSERKEFIKNYGCIAGGTTILTKSGEVPIEKIREGDLVLSYDFESKKTRENRVTNVLRYAPPSCATIELRSGIVMQATGSHPFFVLPDSSWKSAYELKSGDSILSKERSGFGFDIVAKVFSGDCAAEVYDLQVENDHNYFITAEGLLVHNWDPEICKKNREKFNQLMAEGKTKAEAMKQMIPHPPVKEPTLYAGKKKLDTPEGTAKKNDIEGQGKKWGYDKWKERYKDASQKKKVAEEIGEAGAHAGAKMRGLKEVYTPNKASGFPQGFDGVYKDKDGTWVVMEAKGGYNRSGPNSIMKDGYGHRQGSIGWLEGACKRVSESPSTSAQEKKVAQQLYDAIHNGKVRIEGAHTKHRAGEPISTSFYELDKNY